MSENLSSEALALGKTLWEYHQLHHDIAPADVIVCCGSHDLRVPEYAAELWLRGFAPDLVFAGGRGRLTEAWPQPEAETYCQVAVARGVPRERIHLECNSTNTGENIQFTLELFRSVPLEPKRWLLVHKPYMERRAFATFRAYCPETPVRVASPPIAYEDYATDDASRVELIALLVGDTQRVLAYPARGFQIAQQMPPGVQRACERLVALGFDQHALR